MFPWAILRVGICSKCNILQSYPFNAGTSRAGSLQQVEQVQSRCELNLQKRVDEVHLVGAPIAALNLRLIIFNMQDGWKGIEKSVSMNFEKVSVKLESNNRSDCRCPTSPALPKEAQRTSPTSE